jgi:hypothetical protein
VGDQPRCEHEQVTATLLERRRHAFGVEVTALHERLAHRRAVLGGRSDCGRLGQRGAATAAAVGGGRIIEAGLAECHVTSSF